VRTAEGFPSPKKKTKAETAADKKAEDDANNLTKT